MPTNYPNVEKLTRIIDWGLGIIFSLINFGLFLIAALFVILLIVL